MISKYFVKSARLRLELWQILRGNRPVVVGPWLSEVGFELLYWIPFLNWAFAEFNVNRDRVTVISRGGCSSWYQGLCLHYIDIFDLVSPDDFRNRNEVRWKEEGGQKQHQFRSFDKEIISLIRRRIGTDNFAILHPSLMYSVFEPSWGDNLNLVKQHTRFRPLKVELPAEWARELPEKYVAVKFYSSHALATTEQNRRLAAGMVGDLSEQSSVVLLDTGMALDDHDDLGWQLNDSVYSIKHLLTPRNNLAVQTCVIAGAQAFVGNYGGMAFLAPSLGVNTLAVYSQLGAFMSHLYVAQYAFASDHFGSFTAMHTRNFNFVSRLLGNEFER